MKHRGCEIRIMCDGEVLEEYNGQVEGNTIKCYVASDDGKVCRYEHESRGEPVCIHEHFHEVFKIMCSNHSSKELSAKTAIDGREFPRRKHLYQQDKKVHAWRDHMDGIKPLVFSEISITGMSTDSACFGDSLLKIFLDDENAAREPSWATDLGLVRITLVRSKSLREETWSPPTVAPMQNFGPIHETAKKGGLHCVS